jgi:hypothetical protein
MSNTDRARIAALTRHGMHDPKEATEAALVGFRAKFALQADPTGSLQPDERARRANRLMQAHMLRLAARSAEVRARRKAAQ